MHLWPGMSAPCRLQRLSCRGKFGLQFGALHHGRLVAEPREEFDRLAAVFVGFDVVLLLCPGGGEVGEGERE
jgi:hypothetical protein